jgi:flagellar biosynthetic protein FliO
MPRLLLLLWIFISFNAYGAEQVAKDSELKNSLLHNSSIGSSIWQMALGLLLVLAVIFLLAWLMRRVTGIQGSKQHIKILSAVNVGTRERAVLVEVAGEQLLLGVASGQVNLLHKITSPVTDDSTANFSLSLQKAAEKISRNSGVSKPKPQNSDDN